MTSRARKLTVGVALVVITVVVVAVVAGREPDPTPPVALSFVRYEHNNLSAVIQITNQSGFAVEYYYMSGQRRWPDPDEGRLSPYEIEEVDVRVLSNSVHRALAGFSAGVLCRRAATTLRSRIQTALASIGICEQAEEWSVSLDLPPPPKSGR